MCWTPAHTRQTQKKNHTRTKQTHKNTHKKNHTKKKKEQQLKQTTHHIIDSNHIKVQELIVSL